MSSSHRSSTPALLASSNPVDATPEMPASPAPGTGPTTEAASGPALPTTIAARAATALAQLDAIEEMLTLDFVVSPNDRNQMVALSRVSDTALALAADIVSASPGRFVDFAGIPAASSYVQAMTRVAARAAELVTHIQKSLLKERTPAANKTLALYSVVKGLGRIADNETMREKVASLKEEIAPKRKNAKPRLTKEEKAARRADEARAKKVAKARQLLAEAGVSEPGTTAPLVPAPVAALRLVNGIALADAASAPPR